MGRRKIEIQPITHERNRSVTFLKRKNGLFKKAYELGVLCSVDVAVIIFEERPGHQLKLYQYGSTDVRSIVQRHTRYEGEKDNRGPADFSGNFTAKADDNGDGDADDDDGDDDTESMPTRATMSAKRSSNGKMKHDFGTGSPSASSSEPPMSVETDYHHHRPMTIPPPPMPQHPGLPTSSLPISGERLSAHLNANKKLRLMPTASINPSNANRASSDDQYTYQLPGQGPPVPPPSFRLPQQQQSASYDPFSGYPHSPQSLLAGYSQFTSSSGGPPGQTHQNTQLTTHLPYDPYQDHGQQRMLQQLIRQRRHVIQEQPLPNVPLPDLYVEADGHTRRGQGSQNLEAFWPVHGQGAGNHETGSAAEMTWLNLFSGSTGVLPVPSHVQTVATSGFIGERETISWERDRQDGVERVEQVEQGESFNVGSSTSVRSSVGLPTAEVKDEDGRGGEWNGNASENGNENAKACERSGGNEMDEIKCVSTTNDIPDSGES